MEREGEDFDADNFDNFPNSHTLNSYSSNDSHHSPNRNGRNLTGQTIDWKNSKNLSRQLYSQEMKDLYGYPHVLAVVRCIYRVEIICAFLESSIRSCWNHARVCSRI